METEDKLMIELQVCRECDVCRTLMDDSACLLFLEAKTEFKERYGLNYRIRILENVERMGKLCGVYPGVSNFLLQNKTTGKQEQLLTDCLSCRMQFNQTTPYPVYHPIEIFKASYDAHGKN
jgi:hypothetical protein